jgi:hypothetical protein
MQLIIIGCNFLMGIGFAFNFIVINFFNVY